MAVLERLPEQAIIDRFRGSLDFYVSRGQALARSWPRGKSNGYSPASAAMRPVFTRANRLKAYPSHAAMVAYGRYTAGGNHTWADEFLIAYYGNDRPNAQPLPAYPRR